MSKRLREHVKYSVGELDEYVRTEGSCVWKINTNLHTSIGPYCLADFNRILMAHILRLKVGLYDVELEGIVLDVKNVKLLGKFAALRADDPRLHVSVNADVYLFKPTEGAELTGVVKHIGAHHVGVVLYRVFNANLRVCHKVDKEEVQMDQNVKFRIRNYNLQNVFPYIDGEFLTSKAESVKKNWKKITIKEKDNLDNLDNVDSGIEEKTCQEMDELITRIKTEKPDDYENKTSPIKSSKRSKKASESLQSSDSATPEKFVKVKDEREDYNELLSFIKSEQLDDQDNGSIAKKSSKSPKKQPKKIKKEIVFSEDDEQSVKSKKTKKEN